tara:strand:- start:86723 stop:87835 length:1113 start_codon:yes stop_codon:yes gene_type:complete
MELNNFKNLEGKVKKPDFGEDFKSLNMILRGLSIFGNLASIFLASFFLTELLSIAIDNPIVYWIAAIIALSGLELTKREIFYRFSRDFIRTKTIFKSAVLPMLFFTMVLISMSFYSSLSGAQKFISKTDIIETQTTEIVSTFKDSTNLYYQNKIDVLENQNNDLFEANKKTDKQIETLLDEHPTWANTAKKLRDGKTENNTQIEKNDDKIKEIKSERDEVIKTNTDDVEGKSDEEKNKNKSDAYIFIALSTFIEFLILIGIYFNNVYNFRSYRDTKRRLLSDDNFRRYYEYTEILNVVFLNRKEKDPLPDINLMVDLLVMNKVYLTKSQVEKALKLFDALKIVETNDVHTYLLKEKDEAHEVIKEHFHIK